MNTHFPPQRRVIEGKFNRDHDFKNVSYGIIVFASIAFYNFVLSENLNEMLGELFLPCETPEATKVSFFNNLFGGGQKVLDREELCKLFVELETHYVI